MLLSVSTSLKVFHFRKNASGYEICFSCHSPMNSGLSLSSKTCTEILDALDVELNCFLGHHSCQMCCHTSVSTWNSSDSTKTCMSFHHGMLSDFIKKVPPIKARCKHSLRELSAFNHFLNENTTLARHSFPAFV